MATLTLFTVACSNGAEGQFINISDLTNFINEQYVGIANQFIDRITKITADKCYLHSLPKYVIDDVRNTKPTITNVETVDMDGEWYRRDSCGWLVYDLTQNIGASYTDVRWTTGYNNVMFSAKITKSEITVNNPELSEHLDLFQQRYDGTFGVPYNYNHPSAD